MTPIDPYDAAAYERFCADLASEGFNPVPGSPREWVGPTRSSLKQVTDAEFMRIKFRDGWPLRCVYVVVPGLRAQHAGDGIICLWAEDDPAQLSAATLAGLWDRLDQWAESAARGFDQEDQALDSYMLYPKRNHQVLELPLGDLADKTNGYLTHVAAKVKGNLIQVSSEDDGETLHGAFYLRRDIGMPPASLEELRALLTKRQREDLERGLSARQPVKLNEPSGGYDFVILAWPRFGQHDALPIGFEGAADTLEASAYRPSPSDEKGRKQRSGPDVDLLAKKRVLIAGLGSVGGGCALALAECGVGEISGYDADLLTTTNLVRHILPAHLVGYPKTWGLAIEVRDRAPWCDFKYKNPAENLSLDRVTLQNTVAEFDLVIDCTGLFSLAAALSEVCHNLSVPVISTALYHNGALQRVRRQAHGDTPFGLRTDASRYVQLPPGTGVPSEPGSLEVGCTSLVNNAPPWASFRAGTDTAATAVDLLTGRLDFPEDQVTVHRPLAEKPFDQVGLIRMSEHQ